MYKIHLDLFVRTAETNSEQPSVLNVEQNRIVELLYNNSAKLFIPGRGNKPKTKKDTTERKETEKKVHFGRKFRYLIHANQSLSNFCSDLVFFQGTNILRQLFFLLGWAVFSARLISKKTNYRLDDGRKMFFNQKKLFPTWEVLGKRDNTLVARLVQKIVSCFTTWNIIDVQIAFVDFHGQNLVALMEYIKLFQSMNTHLCSVER